MQSAHVHALEGAVPLPDWGLALASGADAAAFLHGQLTQDIANLPGGQVRLAGYCSAKGRLLASFWIWRDDALGTALEAASPTYAMACSADLLAPTLKRLSMFVLRSKCRLADAASAFRLWGLAGPAAQAWAAAAGALPPGSVTPHEGGSLVRLPDAAGLPRWLWAAPVGQCPQGLPELSSEAWRWLEVQSGIARVTAATVERFVPQMVNLELTSGVNFQKGCYPGQEVVARSQYRGTLKRRMFMAHAEVPVQPGQELFHDSDPDQPAGQVVLGAEAPGGGHDALVELKSALAGLPGRLHAGEATLRLGTLPYALPAESSEAA